IYIHISYVCGYCVTWGTAVLRDTQCVAKKRKCVFFALIIVFLSLTYRVPGITIATDIICGFPTETESDFEETMTLCEKYKFPSLFINQFYPRPGTQAARMKRIPANLVKIRTKNLTNLFNSYEPYTDRIGNEYTALVTDISHDKKYYVGHNKFYEQILLPMKENLLGKSVRVRIASVSKFAMVGVLLDDEEKWVACSKSALESNETNGSAATNWTADDNKNAAFLYALIALFLALVYRYVIECFPYL
ncbi:threonylcarbamoyladenosine tRNA methylthiotransferase-like, partial [Contarinia nasturtii]|uniref:threonylcarbamoyladenosine tRNA methylthiotransferase-like n=1 Tax=Contarinia nasturtii TaxID=265458 RepID=UPI0012D494E5